MAILLAILLAASYVDRVILVHLVDLIKADLAVTDFQIGLVVGPAYAIPFAIASYPAGWAADRFERRWIMFLGVIGWSAATMLSALASSFAELLLCRAAVAITEAVMVPAGASMLADRFPAKRLASGMAIYNVGPKGGESLGFLFAAISISVAAGISGTAMPVFGSRSTWQLVLLMAGVPGMVLGFLIWTVREPARRTSRSAAEGHDETFTAFLKSQRVLILQLLAGFCLTGVAASAAGAWAPAFISRTYGWSAALYGPWMGGLSAIGALSIVAKGAIVDWLYSRGIRDAAVRFYTWILIAATPIAIAQFFAPNIYAFFAGYFLVVCVALPFQLFALTTIQLFTPQQFRGRVTGLLFLSLGLVSTGIGSTVTAALTDFVFHDPKKLGWSLAIVTGVCMAVALVLLRAALSSLKRSMNNDQVEANGLATRTEPDAA